MRTERVLIVALALSAGAFALRPLAPGAAASAVRDDAPSIAVCAIPTIVNELMESERFAAEREDLADDFAEATADLERRMESISDRASGMDREDPALPAMGQEFSEIRQELFRLRSQFETDQARLQARHLAESYELARSSALAVGEDLGYTFVFASGDPNEDLNQENAQTLLGQLSRRPVIMFPSEHDITDDVRDDLNL